MNGWDWLYEHHGALVVVAAVAVVGLVIAVGLAARRRSAAPLSVTAACLAAIVLAVSAWVFADARSETADIERRVDDVAAALPSGTTQRTANSQGYAVTKSYDLPTGTDVGALAQHFETAFGDSATVYPTATQGHPQTGVVFVGRHGCEGAVEVFVTGNPGIAPGSPGVTIGAHCET